MAREQAHSQVKRRRKGCVTGCLSRLLMLLGLASLIFVGAHVLGFVQSDPATGKPTLILPEHIGSADLSEWTKLAEGIELPAWAYGVEKQGLTVKALRAGKGEAVLVCADGFTMLIGAGSGTGLALSAQLLACGVNHLNAAVVLSSSDAQIGALPMVMQLMKPEYVFYPGSQVKSKAFARMVSTAEAENVTAMVAKAGLRFSLGRAAVTFVGPNVARHTDERDDGLSLRIDYGGTSILVPGGITAAGEQELVSARANLKADVLICAQGGSDGATCAELVNAAAPSYAWLTGKSPANTVRIRLQRAGAAVYAAADHGVMTLFSDGTQIRMVP